MAKRKTRIAEEIEKEAISIIDRERTNWEDAVCWVTEKVGFRMRELIRTFRKNFWGVFDEPIDKQTGREKIWMGLIMSIVETWVKNCDLDAKDVGFVARNAKGYSITELTRLVVKEYLDKMYFGEILDADMRQVLIDGTVVWKTWEDKSTGKSQMKRKTVNLLNFYIDPTEESIQSAYRVTERSLLLPDQIRGMDGWMNTDEVLVGSQVLNRNDGNRRSSFGSKTTAEMRDLWELWGKIPKWMITGDKKAPDALHEVDGHLIASGLEAGNPVVHLVEENSRKDKFGNIIKPYEEWRVAKVSGRWYGLGVAERALALQEYLNTIVNIRITRSYVSQLGLFKIKKGKGITAQMLNKLPVNGGIQVQDMDDIQQMAVSEMGQSSYNDEEVVKYWAQQVTSAMPISNGDIMPASTTATAAAVASTSAKSGYTIFKEATGLFLERWLDRGAIPIIANSTNVGDILKLTSGDEKFNDLVESIAFNRVYKALEKSDVVPTEEEMLMALAKEEERLRKKPQLLIKATQSIMADMVDSKVHITNEDLDTSATVSNLLTMMQFESPEEREETKKQVYDLLGLDMPRFSLPKSPQMELVGGAPAPVGPGAGPTAGPTAPAPQSATDALSPSLLSQSVA